MKRYSRIIFIIIFAMGIGIGCKREQHKEEKSVITSMLSPTGRIEDIPTVTKCLTPTMTASEQYDAEELEREKIKEALMITPTPGPEPYRLFGTSGKVEVGDVVLYGDYVHPFGLEYNGETSIRWLVLDKQGDEVLLLSLYNITVGSFIGLTSYLEHIENNTELVWENSDARIWLNNYFRVLAFSADEEICIVETLVNTPDNEVYGTEGGADTKDKIFLLSIEEVRNYFHTDTERKTQIFPDVEVMGEMIYEPQEHRPNTTDYYDWWLRSPGETQEHAACVGPFGDIMEEGQLVDCSKVSYRPAMWIDLSKVKEISLR